MSDFQLHPQLASDTMPIVRLDLCRVLLMNDSQYPWLIMVPEVAAVREIHDLTPGDQQRLTSEITHVSRRLQRYSNADKMNVAALGNMVPQLHVHVIARFETDAAWPGPIWGKVPAMPYTQDMAETFIREFEALLKP